MTQGDNANKVIKLLTYVFEDEAPLPAVQRLDLVDGLHLGQIAPLLLQSDGDTHVLAVQPRFSEFFREHSSKSTLNVTYDGRRDLNYEGVKSEEEKAKRKVDHFLLAAMVHVPRFLAPYASFVTIPSESRICHSSRMKDFGYFGSPDHDPLTEAEFTSINQLYSPIKKILIEGAAGRLPTALRYYQQSFRSDIEWTLGFLGMMMAMEALFGHGTTEIAHQVSERTAFFLKQTPDEQEQLYDLMKQHYSLRSKIAHGGTPNVGQVKAEASYEHLLQTLRDALVRILRDPALLNLFGSGNDDQFRRSMRSLVFRGAVTGIESDTGADQ